MLFLLKYHNLRNKQFVTRGHYVGAEIKNRFIFIDLLKCIAVFFVFLTHLFAQTSFFGDPLHGMTGALAITTRTLCLTCVPLFLVATGYLMKEKALSAGYYRGIIHTLIVYVLVSIFRMLSYTIIGFPEAWSENVLFSSLHELLDVGYTGYTWYIEMYIGLYLMIPFLNILYEALGTKNRRAALLATLIILVSLPTQLNIDMQIFPNWWSSSLFPILYYYVGSFFRDYPPIMRPARAICLLIGATILIGIFNTLMCYWHFNHFFGYPVYTDNQGSIELLLLTVCIFTLLSNLKLPTSDSLTGKITSSISKLTLGAYLSSWVYNRCVMLAGFLSAIPFNEQLRLLPLCFILVAIPSFLTSAIITRIADLLTALVNRLHFS